MLRLIQISARTTRNGNTSNTKQPFKHIFLQRRPCKTALTFCPLLSRIYLFYVSYKWKKLHKWYLIPKMWFVRTVEFLPRKNWSSIRKIVYSDSSNEHIKWNHFFAWYGNKRSGVYFILCTLLSIVFFPRGLLILLCEFASEVAVGVRWNVTEYSRPFIVWSHTNTKNDEPTTTTHRQQKKQRKSEKNQLFLVISATNANK